MLGIDRRLAVVWFPAFALLTALTYADVPRVFGDHFDEFSFTGAVRSH